MLQETGKLANDRLFSIFQIVACVGFRLNMSQLSERVLQPHATFSHPGSEELQALWIHPISMGWPVVAAKGITTRRLAAEKPRCAHTLI